MGVLNRICNDRHRAVWEVNPAIPDELSHIIDRLLEKRASRRYSGAVQVRQALLQALNHCQRGGTSRLTRVRRFVRRRRWLMPASVAAVGGVAILVAASVLGNRGERSDDRVPVTQSVEAEAIVTWQEDDAAYVGAIGGIQHQLDWLETTAESTYLHVPSHDWNAEIGALHNQLDEIEVE